MVYVQWNTQLPSAVCKQNGILELEPEVISDTGGIHIALLWKQGKMSAFFYIENINTKSQFLLNVRGFWWDYFMNSDILKLLTGTQ